MNDLDAFKGVIDDLTRRKAELHQHIQEFQNLSAEVCDLQRRALTDPGAKQKIIRLQAVMDHDFLQHRALLMEKVSSVTENMQELVKMLQIDDVRNDQTYASTAVKTVSAGKKKSYAFV
jgi:hypothetical protein